MPRQSIIFIFLHFVCWLNEDCWEPMKKLFVTRVSICEERVIDKRVRQSRTVADQAHAWRRKSVIARVVRQHLSFFCASESLRCKVAGQ